MNEVVYTQKNWIEWAKQLQAIAQSGLYYTNNKFEVERYEQVRNIAKEILNTHSYVKLDKINEFFCCERGYCTPKLDSRSVCFRDNKILLVQEMNGKWSIPGGWVDENLTIRQNLVKEAYEEAGAKVKPKFLIMLHDWKSHISLNKNLLAFQIVKVFCFCELLDINFKPNSETLSYGFYSLDNLPNLALEKNNYEQISNCFDAYNSYIKKIPWVVQFD